MTNITLSTDQQNAVSKFKKFLRSSTETELALEGHAGTGKTFLTNYLIDLTYKINDLNSLVTNSPLPVIEDIYLTATTNKAAAVLLQNCSKISPSRIGTIHSLLKLKVKNDYHTGKKYLTRNDHNFQPMRDSLIIVDEASMVNKELLEAIRSSCDNCKILYILDPYQLAPVHENSCPVSEEISNKITLNKIFRQTGGNNSPIAMLAEQYRQVLDGNPFPTIQDNGTSILRVDKDTFRAMIAQEFSSLDHNTDAAKVLMWTNKAVHSCNNYIRNLHTTSTAPLPGEYMSVNELTMAKNGRVLARPDEIVQIQHVYPRTATLFGIECHIYDIGRQNNVYAPINSDDLTRLIKKTVIEANKRGNWHKFFKIKESFIDLRPVYASTIHKSQGSTHNKVFINLNDIAKNRNPHEVARLMYVATTRAVEQVIFHGNLGPNYGD